MQAYKEYWNLGNIYKVLKNNDLAEKNYKLAIDNL